MNCLLEYSLQIVIKSNQNLSLLKAFEQFLLRLENMFNVYNNTDLIIYRINKRSLLCHYEVKTTFNINRRFDRCILIAPV